MDKDALAALEFPAVVELIAAATTTPGGERLARSLVPSSNTGDVTRRQALTAEAIGLIDLSVEPALHGIHDVRAEAERAGRGGVLPPSALSAIASAIRGALAARTSLDAQAEHAPLLCELAAAIDPQLAPLADELGRCVEDDGSDLRDGASPLLRRLRKEL